MITLRALPPSHLVPMTILISPIRLVGGAVARSGMIFQIEPHLPDPYDPAEVEEWMKRLKRALSKLSETNTVIKVCVRFEQI